MGNKRILEFDILRTCALILMPLAHLEEIGRNMNLLSLDAVNNSSWILEISSFGVVIFMTMLGVNVLLTHKNSPQDLLKRSLTLLLVGVILNVLRYIIPGCFLLILTGDISNLNEGIYYTFSSDILYFASLSFLTFAIIKKTKTKGYVVLLVGCFLSLLDGFIGNLSFSDTLIGAVVSNYIYIGYQSAFAFSQWLVIVAFGYHIGEILIKRNQLQDQEKFYKFLLFGLLDLSVMALIISKGNLNLANITGCQNTDYCLTLYGALFHIGIFSIILSLVHFVAKHLKNNKIINFFSSFSKSITVYYFAQWVFVCLGYCIVYIFNPDASYYITNFQFWILGIIIIILSYLCGQLYKIKQISKA